MNLQKRLMPPTWKKHPDDTFANLKYARVLHRLGERSKALDAFLQASDKAETADAMAVAQLFLAKKMYTQAEHWFRSAEKKAPSQSPLPYLGLLEVRLSLKDENSAETLMLAMEKTHPGSLDKSEHAKTAADLLKRRRSLDFFQRGYATDGKTASETGRSLTRASEGRAGRRRIQAPPPHSRNLRRPSELSVIGRK